MKVSRRQFAAISGTALIGLIGHASATFARGARVLRISHHFPGGTLHHGDFRDRLCRKFGDEVEKRTKGALKFLIYPSASLMKTYAQTHALRIGALDMSLLPLSYAGGEIPELNITAMPGIVTSYEHGFAWKHSKIARALEDLLADKGLHILTWVWQAGATAGRGKPILRPEDVRGLKVRGGSRDMDLLLRYAGAAVITLPSNEVYVAMQTGAMEAAVTSSTSLISFRLQEVSDYLITATTGTYWYVFQPLLISRSVFESLPKDQQVILMQVGAELEDFALETAQADDSLVVDVYKRAGAQTFDLDRGLIWEWREAARAGAWFSFAKRSPGCARFLRLAEQVGLGNVNAGYLQL